MGMCNAYLKGRYEGYIKYCVLESVESIMWTAKGSGSQTWPHIGITRS